jgi:hypothetical protein
MKLEFSRQIFEKYSDLKFHENPSIGVQVIPWGWMERRTDRDRHDEVDTLRTGLFHGDGWKDGQTETDTMKLTH